MKKNALNSQLQPYQMLTNDDQMLILCLSYFITTVSGNRFVAEDQDSDKSSSNSRKLYRKLYLLPLKVIM